MSVILAGDVGATKTILGSYEIVDGELRRRSRRLFSSAEYGSLDAILSSFLADHADAAIDAACLGVAGPVSSGVAEITNLSWSVSEAALCEVLGCSRVRLVNDMVAMAYGVLHVENDQTTELNAGDGVERAGNIAVLAAGTGLGEAILVWDGARHLAMGGEGGHKDFAPRNEGQDRLLRWLRDQVGGRVSLERILTGSGLHRIYRHVIDSRQAIVPPALAERLVHEDPAAVISEAGLAGTDPHCAAALEMFCSIYGAEAGDLALQCLARGGVVLGGGIAPKILSALQSGIFVDAFTDKGRFADLVRAIPVRVVLDPDAALLGAAHHAWS